MSKAKPQLEAKKAGRSVIINTHDGIKYSRSFKTAEERTKIITQVVAYNEKPGIRKLNAIIKVMEAPKVLAAANKAATKRDTKVKGKGKEKNKVVVSKRQVSKNVEEKVVATTEAAPVKATKRFKGEY